VVEQIYDPKKKGVHDQVDQIRHVELREVAHSIMGRSVFQW
jgi:hypothetical protein